MSTWILIVLVLGRISPGGNAPAITSVDGFRSQTTCERAAEEAVKRIAKTPWREVTALCVAK